jgi:hypothetical protein
VLEKCALNMVTNRSARRDFLAENIQTRKLNEHFKRRFNSRMDAFMKLECFLFKCSKISHLLLFLMQFFRKKILAALEAMSGKFVHNFSKHDALFIHFCGGQSFTTTEKYMRAITCISKGFVKFPKMSKIRAARDALPIGVISIFQNPDGKSRGRFWEAGDMIKRTLENRTLVKNLKFGGTTADDAELILEFNIDGLSANYSNILCCVSRWVNLGETSRNPLAAGSGDGDETVRKHRVRLSVVYCCDEKAFKLMLPIQPSICRRCNTNLRREGHNKRTCDTEHL